MSTTTANTTTTRAGKVRPVCETCGKLGRAVVPLNDGSVPMFGLSRGWSVAPYSPTFVHDDGSMGDRFVCPRCYAAARRAMSGAQVETVPVWLYPGLFIEVPRDDWEALTPLERVDVADHARRAGAAAVLRIRGES